MLQQYKKWYSLRHNKIYEIPPNGTSFIAFAKVSDCPCYAWPIGNHFTFKADNHYFQSCNKHNKQHLQSGSKSEKSSNLFNLTESVQMYNIQYVYVHETDKL